jgi:hypothetical protein
MSFAYPLICTVQRYMTSVNGLNWMTRAWSCMTL